MQNRFKKPSGHSVFTPGLDGISCGTRLAFGCYKTQCIENRNLCSNASEKVLGSVFSLINLPIEIKIQHGCYSITSCQ